MEDALLYAAKLIHEADGILITAGAGMGVDSGLPDFRGTKGFWNTYGSLKDKQLCFEDIANPSYFERDPRLVWGFYGHRLQLYRNIEPHRGFNILHTWASKKTHGAFVFTSNVDGQFQKAGFNQNQIVECHGSIHNLQCTSPCSPKIWTAEDITVDPIDPNHCQWAGDIPICPHCGKIARPNILMFGDKRWLSEVTNDQYTRLDAWLKLPKNPVVIELGAGTAIPSVRRMGEGLGWPIVRINIRESQVDKQNQVAISLGALNALDQIDSIIASLNQQESTRKQLPQKAADVSLLSKQDADGLTQKTILDFDGNTLELDFKALSTLIEDAQRALRVYELMSIRRVGDVLHYGFIGFPTDNDEFQARIKSRMKIWSLELENKASCPEAIIGLNLMEMDEMYHGAGDDTSHDASIWLRLKKLDVWKKRMHDVFEVVRRAQQQLREIDDILIRTQVALIDAGNHPLDYQSAIQRVAARDTVAHSELPEVLTDYIVSLVDTLNLPSVAADVDDLEFWKKLYRLQLIRAELENTTPENALALFASDNGVPLSPDNWEGYVFVSYEGIRIGALTVLPSWQTFDAEAVRNNGNLLDGFSNAFIRRHMEEDCMVLVSLRYLGEFDCARRETIEKWNIYIRKNLS